MVFYIVNNNLFDDDKFAYGEQYDNFSSGDAIKCEECGSFLTMRKWLPPYQIKVSKKQLGDFIWGTFPGFIISKNFMSEYLKSGLKGLNDFCKVNLFYRNILLIDKEYYYPKITLSGVRVNIKESGIKFEGTRTCNLCQRAGRPIKDMKGIIFDSSNNIKEDIFNTKVIGGVIVSERFKEFIDENNFTNITLQNASTYIPSWILKR